MGLKRTGTSPADELDRTLRVASPRGWVALSTILAIVAACTAWSVFGEYSTYVEARGLLLRQDGMVVDAVANGTGRLEAITVAPGDGIEKDTVVAVIVNEELAGQYANMLSLVEERSRALAALRDAVAEEENLALANNSRSRRRLDDLETTAREVLEVAEANFDSASQLFEEGIISRIELLRAQRELNQAQLSLIELNQERDALAAAEVVQKNENAARIMEMRAQVQAAERRAGEIETLLSAERILAPAAGQVTEIKAATGSIVVPGQAVASIRTGTEELDVLLYVPPAAGEQVEAGMESLVSPVAIRREEFGAIRGTVESISTFPVSFEGMVAVLQNQNLARTLSEDGPPYVGRVSLLADPATASGFAWTSPRASGQTLTAGMLVSVEIKTRSQAPITLAIPLLREMLGM